MSRAKRSEQRALAADERDAVAQSRGAILAQMPSKDRVQLRARLRAMRDKARDILRQQRRELRGKSPPRGATPTADDRGSHLKERALSSAVKRLNRAVSRDQGRQRSQPAISKAALRIKRDARGSEPHPASPLLEDPGMLSRPDRERAPSGALNEEGQRPVLERSHKER